MEGITLVQVGGIVAFMVAFAKGLEYLAQPFTKQAKRIEVLEQEMKESKEDRKEMHEYMKVNFIALKELLKHNIDGGNNIKGMQMANDEIDKYLTRKL